ncbi:MAG TPA: xanthine dehydrogenase family protein subunit M [bacterium]|nr:xanthine dehydrogenase family protein subunit M [bacterium]
MLPRFGYLRPATLGEALRALDDYAGEARLLAGGTDLLISMKDGLARPKYVIDIKQIPELRTLRVTGGSGLTIGACVTVNELLAFGALPAGMTALREAASWLGTHQVRHRATVGGNLCNASPACDLAPPLLVLDATVKALSAKGERAIPLKDFMTCPKETCLARHELVTEIVVPPADGTRSGFAKRTRIRGHDLSVVNAAVALSVDGVSGGRSGPRGKQAARLRIALGAVAPTPLLVEGLDGLDPGDEAGVMKVILGAISPIDDVRGSGLYRKAMVRVLIGDLLKRLREGGSK